MVPMFCSVLKSNQRSLRRHAIGSYSKYTFIKNKIRSGNHKHIYTDAKKLSREFQLLLPWNYNCVAPCLAFFLMNSRTQTQTRTPAQ